MSIWACDPCMKGDCSNCESDGPEGKCYCAGEGHPPPIDLNDVGVM